MHLVFWDIASRAFGKDYTSGAEDNWVKVNPVSAKNMLTDLDKQTMFEAYSCFTNSEANVEGARSGLGFLRFNGKSSANKHSPYVLDALGNIVLCKDIMLKTKDHIEVFMIITYMIYIY